MVESRSGQRQLSLDDVRDLIDVCWMAKRITEALPELPKNMKPRHVHVIDASGISIIVPDPRLPPHGSAASAPFWE